MALARRRGQRAMWADLAPAAGPPQRAVVATTFSGRARSVLLGFKLGNRRRLAGHLGGLLVNAVVAAGAEGDMVDTFDMVDVVTWAPTSREHRAGRGFDQAELVAREVARQLRVPCRQLLRRVDNRAQQGRSRVERLQPTDGRFSARGEVTGRILVVDDVVTTGSTLASAVAALVAAGADVVVPAAVAATPAVRQRRLLAA